MIRSVVQTIVMVVLLLAAMPANAQTNYHDPSTWLLGEISMDMLIKEPHMQWFNQGFDEYSPSQSDLGALLSLSKEDITITIVMGTWCPDSRREVPRFMKLMAAWGFPQEKIRFVGVDSQKKAPLGNYEELGILKVPTFIIFRNKNEVGRIIEYPETSLERDLVIILTRDVNNDKE